jgi:hypothetical protein
MFWGWASLFMGARLGNLEWARVLGIVEMAERGSGVEAFLSVGVL